MRYTLLFLFPLFIFSQQDCNFQYYKLTYIEDIGSDSLTEINPQIGGFEFYNTNNNILIDFTILPDTPLENDTSFVEKSCGAPTTADFNLNQYIIFELTQATSINRFKIVSRMYNSQNNRFSLEGTNDYESDNWYMIDETIDFYDNNCDPSTYTISCLNTGCIDEEACNYNSFATIDDGSCYNNDLGCGCDTPAAEEGFDCDGNPISTENSNNNILGDVNCNGETDQIDAQIIYAIMTGQYQNLQSIGINVNNYDDLVELYPCTVNQITGLTPNDIQEIVQTIEDNSNNNSNQSNSNTLMYTIDGF
tara:strand:- start:89 stop:1006 length:918 start_codon:yes stop_codon:yes gene_type:complete